MNLLARTAVALRHLARPDAVFTGLVLTTVLAIELIGRVTPSDLHDLLALSFVGMLTMLVLARHRQRPLPWVSAIGQTLSRLGQRVRRLGFQIGLDLRGHPPVKRGVPPSVVGLIGVTGFALAGLLLIHPICPVGLRAGLIRFSYLIYLLAAVLLWGALLAATLLAVFIPLAMIHDACIAGAKPGRSAARCEAFWGILYVSGLAFSALIFPLWVAPALLAGLWAAYVAAAGIGRRDAVRFVWRPLDSIAARSLTWAEWVIREYTILALLFLDLVLLSCGHRLFTVPTAEHDPMPLTTFLGVTLAWLSPGMLAVLLGQTVQGRWNDPARAARPVAHVTPPARGELTRGEIRRAFARHGWKVRMPPTKPGPLDVGVVLVSQPDPLPRGEVWPLAVRPTDLWKADLFARLARRDDLQKRRKFAAGLERLFKYRASRPIGGQGMWLAPHLWFITALMRDGKAEDEEFDYTRDAILSAASGPPFSRVFPREVRHHLYKVLRALQVDLIFVEDGISFRRFRRVLRAMYEKYDAHGGREAIAESDFRGVPGVRVLLHDFQFDDPFRSNHYPEPSYDHLGRARILHVFKDRSGDEDEVTPPVDRTNRPIPAGVA